MSHSLFVTDKCKSCSWCVLRIPCYLGTFKFLHNWAVVEHKMKANSCLNLGQRKPLRFMFRKIEVLLMFRKTIITQGSQARTERNVSMKVTSSRLLVNVYQR